MTNLRHRPTALVWLVWGTAELFYIVAVMNRTSLATLGPTAQIHFGIEATVLSSFAVLQLVVYAAMQIPVGAMIDRFGVSVMLISGGIIMLIGQLGMAVATEVWVAVAARMLVGMGDAFTFISAIRLLVDWFPVRMIPIMSQITGTTGHLGQIISVVPLALAVDAFGWTTGFVGVAAVCGIVVLLGVLVLRDRPGTGTVLERLTGRVGRATKNSAKILESGQVGLAALPPTTEAVSAVSGEAAATTSRPKGAFWTILGIPGVRLGFWMHFTPQFVPSVLLWLWGTPFFVGGLGYSAEFIAAILIYMVVIAAVAGVLLGPITSRFAHRRVSIVVGLVWAMILSWGAVILWPGVPPTWLVLTMITIVSTGGPASMISFEVNRTHSPRRMSGLSTGFVNMGGFIAGFIAMFLIGLALDLQGAGEPETYRLDAFRVAFATQLVPWTLGLVMISIERRKAARWLESRGRSVGPS